jgi:hypothetical protein
LLMYLARANNRVVRSTIVPTRKCLPNEIIWDDEFVHCDIVETEDTK